MMEDKSLRCHSKVMKGLFRQTLQRKNSKCGEGNERKIHRMILSENLKEGERRGRRRIR